MTENNETTIYIYSGFSVLYEETMTGSATYIYGPEGRLAKRTTINEETNTFFYHTDRLKSTRLVTDGNRNIVTDVIYHPFGEPCTEEGSEYHLFTGKEKDATGLYYYGARYYDPEVGRFLTRDQKIGRISRPQTLNQYTYCINNPTRYLDPDGHDYFDPDWAKEWRPGDPLPTSFSRQSLGLFFSLILWMAEQNFKAGDWLYDVLTETWADDYAAWGVAVKLGPHGAAIGIIYILWQHIVLENLDELWNDPEFRSLFSTTKKYAKLESLGGPYEKELWESFILILAYAAQQVFGDSWCNQFPWLAMQYNMIMQLRKMEEETIEDQAEDSGRMYNPPPSIDPI